MMITSIRAPLPVAEAPLPTQADPSRPAAVVSGGVAAVATPDSPNAVRQAPCVGVADDARLWSLRTTVETNAAEAAEAARAAYIRASIAAGINPLPLTGG